MSRVVTVTIRLDLDRLADPTAARAEVGNAVYQVGQAIFETGAEYNRRPDGSRVLTGNGHHVAQELAEHAQGMWDRRTA